MDAAQRSWIMKKESFSIRISAVLAYVLIVSFLITSCKALGKKKSDPLGETTVNSTFPEQFLDTDQLAFTVTGVNGGPFQWGTDYWTRTVYDIYYNGKITIRTTYEVSGDLVVTKDISYVHLKRIRALADSFLEKESEYDLDFSNYYDGDSWSFCAYDTNGSRVFIYSGLIYGVSELVSIKNILSGYEDTTNATDRAYDIFEGTYVCPDDDQQYVSLYKKDRRIYLEVRYEGAVDPVVYEIQDITYQNDGISFGYVEDKLWHYIAYRYSPGKTQITDKDTSVVYKKQMKTETTPAASEG